VNTGADTAVEVIIGNISAGGTRIVNDNLRAGTIWAVPVKWTRHRAVARRHLSFRDTRKPHSRDFAILTSEIDGIGPRLAR
jgi:hypothetical protein